VNAMVLRPPRTVMTKDRGGGERSRPNARPVHDDDTSDRREMEARFASAEA